VLTVSRTPTVRVEPLVATRRKIASRLPQERRFLSPSVRRERLGRFMLLAVTQLGTRMSALPTAAARLQRALEIRHLLEVRAVLAKGLGAAMPLVAVLVDRTVLVRLAVPKLLEVMAVLAAAVMVVALSALHPHRATVAQAATDFQEPAETAEHPDRLTASTADLGPEAAAAMEIIQVQAEPAATVATIMTMAAAAEPLLVPTVVRIG
jgi:hypothetical protein